MIPDEVQVALEVIKDEQLKTIPSKLTNCCYLKAINIIAKYFDNLNSICKQKENNYTIEEVLANSKLEIDNDSKN